MGDITFNVVLSKEAKESMSKPGNISIGSTMKECIDNAERPFSEIIKVEYLGDNQIYDLLHEKMKDLGITEYEIKQDPFSFSEYVDIIYKGLYTNITIKYVEELTKEILDKKVEKYLLSL